MLMWSVMWVLHGFENTATKDKVVCIACWLNENAGRQSVGISFTVVKNGSFFSLFVARKGLPLLAEMRVGVEIWFPSILFCTLMVFMYCTSFKGTVACDDFFTIPSLSRIEFKDF
jgi:hypothetical protein